MMIRLIMFILGTMMMIEEKYVDFGIAKLLKENGFDEVCQYQYINCSSGHPYLTDIQDDAGNYYKNSEIENDEFCAPTLQTTIKYVKEKYDYHIVATPHCVRDENIKTKELIRQMINNGDISQDVAEKYCPGIVDSKFNESLNYTKVKSKI